MGYRLGAKWAINLLEGRTNILNPGTHQDLVALLQRRRVAAILMNGYTLESFGPELDNATITPLINLSAHTWIRSSLQHRANEINAAIVAFIESGRKFSDNPSTRPEE